VVQALRVPGAALPITGYVEAIRNTPELVQLFWIYLVLPELGINLTINQAVLGYLTVNGTAYATEIVRGGVLSIPRGQFEAARALGLRGVRLYRRIVLPQALRKVLPSIVNQMIMVLKGTTLVSFIAGQDVVYYANHLSSLTMQPVPFQVYTGLMFFAVITVLSALVRRLEFGGAAA
jgi:polar amino acid transport system permease protein